MNIKKEKTAIDQILSPGGIIVILFFALWGVLMLWMSTNTELEKAERYITYLHNNMPEKLGRRLNKEYNQARLDEYDDRQSASEY